jgi:hypothetical protein
MELEAVLKAALWRRRTVYEGKSALLDKAFRHVDHGMAKWMQTTQCRCCCMQSCIIAVQASCQL